MDIKYIVNQNFNQNDVSFKELFKNQHMLAIPLMMKSLKIPKG